MIDRSIWISSLFVVGALLSGCSSGGSGYTPTPAKPAASETFKPGDELAMFPAKVGNQWTYLVEQTSAAKGKNTVSLRGELTLKVTAVSPIEGGNVMELDVFQPAKDPQAGPVKVDHQVWEVSKRGIFQRSTGLNARLFNPPQPDLLFPPDAQRKFAWKGTGPTPTPDAGSQTVNSTVLAGQLVDTEGGQVWAIPVESKGTFQTAKTKGQVESIAYWSPNIGLVRFRQAVSNGNELGVFTMKLKTKSVQ